MTALLLERFAAYPACFYFGIYTFSTIFSALLHPDVGIQRRVSDVEAVDPLGYVDYWM